MLIDKYRPTKIDDLIGNRSGINQLIQCIVSINSSPNKFLNKNSVCVLIGPSGIGKTLISKLALKELDYDIKEIGSCNVNSTKSFKNLINNYLTSPGIEYFFKKRKRAIFIDELDTLSVCDRGIVSSLVTYISLSRKRNNTQNISNIPIVCTCNNSDEKKLSELKKNSQIIYLKYPSTQELTKYFLRIVKLEKIAIDKSRLSDLIQANHNDIRAVFTQLDLENLTVSPSNRLTTSSKPEIEVSVTPTDLNFFEIVKILYRRKLSISRVEDYLQCDNVLIPMILHENINTELCTYRNIKNIEALLAANIALLEGLYLADSLEAKMHNINEWGLIRYINISKCNAINHLLSRDKKYNNYVVNDDYIPYKFTQILTKSSLAFNYYKKRRKFNYKAAIEPVYNFDLFMCIRNEIDNITNKKDLQKYLDTVLLQDNEYEKDDYDVFIKYLNDFDKDFNKKNINYVKKRIK